MITLSIFFLGFNCLYQRGSTASYASTATRLFGKPLAIGWAAERVFVQQLAVISVALSSALGAFSYKHLCWQARWRSPNGGVQVPVNFVFGHTECRIILRGRYRRSSLL